MKRTVSIACIVITVILAIIGFAVLPSPVIVQIGSDGLPSNTMPKLFAVALPVVLSVVGGLLSGIYDKHEGSLKGIVVSIAGVGIGLFTLIANCLLFA